MTGYKAYYAACRAGYSGDGAALGLYGLGVRVQVPRSAGADDLFSLDDGYLTAVAELAAEVDRRIGGGIGIYRNRNQHAAALAVQLDAFWQIEALEVLAGVLVPQAEAAVLGCHAVVNQVNLIRNVPTSAPPASSWLWHYDNKPDEACKILVYLTDVGAEDGAFEYLRRPATGEVVRIESSRPSPETVLPPRWPQSRVPTEAIDRYGEFGFRPHRVVGPRGTLIAFDNNCVHRATVPTGRPRDALILNLRPCHERVRPFISERHTGSWNFNAKQWIPDRVDIRAAEHAR